jgi:exosortase
MAVGRGWVRAGVARAGRVRRGGDEDAPAAARAVPLPTLRAAAPHLVAALGFLVVFREPMVRVGRSWLTNPDFGHGLLLAPVIAYLVWQRGLAPGARAQPVLGLSLLVLSVLLRYLSQVGRLSFVDVWTMMAALVALTIFWFGVRQLLHWWLPVLLLLLCLPFNTGSVLLPLQLLASRLGAGLFAWDQVPVVVSGNIIHLPGRDLFVTEACSGLRSITSLLALGVLMGGLYMRSPWSRLSIVLLAVPVAVVINAFRVFLTGFLILFVDPRWADGFLHATEGWLMFVMAFSILGVIAWVITTIERPRGTAA